MFRVLKEKGASFAIHRLDTSVIFPVKQLQWRSSELGSIYEEGSQCYTFIPAFVRGIPVASSAVAQVTDESGQQFSVRTADKKLHHSYLIKLLDDYTDFEASCSESAEDKLLLRELSEKFNTLATIIITPNEEMYTWDQLNEFINSSKKNGELANRIQVAREAEAERAKAREPKSSKSASSRNSSSSSKGSNDASKEDRKKSGNATGGRSKKAQKKL